MQDQLRDEELWADLVALAEGAPATARLERYRSEHREAFERAERQARALVRAAAGARLEPYSEADVHRAQQVLERELSGTSPWRRLLAALVAPPAEPAVALRDQGGATRFQALFSAGEYDIDLTLDEGGALVGQILSREGEEVGAGRVSIHDAEGRISEVELDSTGSFIVSAVPPQPIDLVFEFDSTQVTIPGVRVQA